uniref:SUN domain-containing protein n=1 Tax=Strongyloides stercoralis TaxID=6248 RepID=A0A0K0EJE2_STRER
MNSSTSSTIKSAPTSTNNGNTTNKDNTETSKHSSIKKNVKDSQRESSFVSKKNLSAKKTVSFSKDTDFTTNHRLVKINPKDEKSKYMLTKKQLKLRELVKSKVSLIDYGKMVLFYVILLSIYFIYAFIMYLIFKPSDIGQPIIHGESSFHGYEPKLIAIPMEKHATEKIQLVKFDQSDPNSYKSYITKIETFLKSFKNTNNGRNCSVGETNKDVNDGLLKEKNFCLNNENFPKLLSDCTTEHDFGFKYGNPCFFITLNNHLNWVPGNLNEKYINENKLNDIDTNHHIPITCNNPDNNIKIEYENKNGINKKFYPYLNIKGFHKGYLIVQLYDLVPNKEYIITCIAHTGNDHKKFKNEKSTAIIRIIKSQ